MIEPTSPPKVFVSYSWTSEEHKKWVLDLAERLTHDGVEVVLDRWHLRPGQDKYVFMEQTVNDPTVTKVLVVCDRVYAEKADGRKGGVGTETQIISDQVYREVSQEKFLPLVREWAEDGQPWLPAFMASRIYIDFARDEGFDDAYDALVRNLHNAPELKRPTLGRPPAHLFNRDATVVTTGGKFQRLRDAAEKGKPNVGVVLRDYLENFADALDEFRITAAPAGKIEPDEVVIDLITRMRPYRDEFIEFCAVYASHLDTEAAYTEVHDLLERLLQLHHQTDSMGSYSEWYFAAHQVLGYELVLYLLATLIHDRRYKTAARFMGDSYHVRRPLYGDLRGTGIDGFNPYPPVLEEYRKQRLSLNRYSIVADLIKEGATHRRITFRQLFEVDMLLMLRPLIIDPVTGVSWYPRLSAYAEPENVLDVFARATTTKGLAAIRDLFGVRDVKELARKVQAVLQNTGLVRFFQSERFMFRRAGVARMCNWEELQRLLIVS